MTGETGMSLAVAGRKRQTVRRLAECSSKKLKLRQETIDGRLLTEGRPYCGTCRCSANDDRRRRRPGMQAWYRWHWLLGLVLIPSLQHLGLATSKSRSRLGLGVLFTTLPLT